MKKMVEEKVNTEEMQDASSFFKWAFETRAKNVIGIYEGKEITRDRLFLDFTSHNPALVTNGPGGLNASIKGIGFVPKKEYMEDILAKYIEHINSYKKDDKEYSQRGLALLVKEIYSDDVRHKIDFTKITTLELAKNHTWQNVQDNNEATYIFYQPPVISYELRGKMEIDDDGLYKKFVNAQHDVYHAPDMTRWDRRPALVFHIEEVYNNSVSKNGFGKQMKYPYL